MLIFIIDIMSAKELSNMVFSIKDKITDKEFKDIMDKLSIKNEKEKEDEVELYEFTYMKMRKPQVFKFHNSCSTYGYNLADYKIKTKNIIIDSNIDPDVITNKNNYLHKVAFNLSKVKNKNYYKLSKGIFSGGPIDNSIREDYLKNPLASDDEGHDEDGDCDCDWGCDKCIFKNLKKQKGVDIMYRKMIGLSLKKIK